MKVNTFMHPRNPYKDKPADFTSLAAKNDQFRAATSVDLAGKIHVDFKNPSALAALTQALLKEDFKLDIHLPLNRLIPAIPLRLNYILWLQDHFPGQSKVRGVDIGCGASCVYPLLGARNCGWTFLATELDPTSYDVARDNVRRNGLSDAVSVVRVQDPDTLLCGVLPEEEGADVYDFCMCNPPFYGSVEEAAGLRRSEDVTESPGVNTAAPVEMVTEGGEESFVLKLVRDSVRLRGRVKVYTSMLGKKSSLRTVRRELAARGVSNVATAEFCQGKTVRWAVAWSFDDQARLHTMLKPSTKERPPLSAMLHGREFGHVRMDVTTVFAELEILASGQRARADLVTWDIAPERNTWTGLRRKRRRRTKPVPEVKPETCVNGEFGEASRNSLETDSTIQEHNLPTSKRKHEERNTAILPDPLSVKHVRTTSGSVITTHGEISHPGPCSSRTNTETNSTEESEQKLSTCADAAKDRVKEVNGESVAAGSPLFKGHVTIRDLGVGVMLEMDGSNRDLVYQLFVCLRNKLSPSTQQQSK